MKTIVILVFGLVIATNAKLYCPVFSCSDIKPESYDSRICYQHNADVPENA
jgi:hypothetical protein